MKNLEFVKPFPFIIKTEPLVTGIVTYDARLVDCIESGYSCDVTDYMELINNKKYRDLLVWSEVHFAVYNKKNHTILRNWKLLEDRQNRLWWWDCDNNKWKFAI